MRIIAGEFRGRKLLPPQGDQTRPITDRVKQSLFDILAPHLETARIYDCFAGTGSMGLESLSRGAAHATFFEQHRGTAARLRQNIDALGLADRSRLITSDLFKWFASTPHGHAEVVFLDPPYRFLAEEPAALKQVVQTLVQGHLSPGGIVVFRHDARDQLELPRLVRYDQRLYGGMNLEFLIKSDA